MYYIYYEYHDPSGDGIRAKLDEASSEEEASAQFRELSHDPDTVDIKVFEASEPILQYRLLPGSQLSVDEIQASTIDV